MINNLPEQTLLKKKNQVTVGILHVLRTRRGVRYLENNHFKRQTIRLSQGCQKKEGITYISLFTGHVIPGKQRLSMQI